MDNVVSEEDTKVEGAVEGMAASEMEDTGNNEVEDLGEYQDECDFEPARYVPTRRFAQPANTAASKHAGTHTRTQASKQANKHASMQAIKHTSKQR